MLRYTRTDLAVELRLRQLHPREVHLAVEGETEVIVCRRVLEEIAGMPLEDTGVTVQSFRGVGGLQQEVLRALRAFPRYLILVADREGDMERKVKCLQDQGVLTDETTLLWDTSFEEENFTAEELVSMIATAGAEAGATLALDAASLRRRYDEHRARVGHDAKGFGAYALGLARQPEHGNVAVSKPKLAELMADLILDDLRRRDPETVGAVRPIVAMLVSVFRVT